MRTKSQKEPKVLSIGEILFDVYPDYKKLGGAPFNFIYHIKNLTGKGVFVSRIGEDALGEEIKEFLTKNDFDLNYLQVDGSHSTGRATVKLSEEKVPEFTIDENKAYDFIEWNKQIEDYVKNQANLVYYGTLAQRNQVSRTTIQKLMEQKPAKFCDLNIRQDYYDKEIITESVRNSDVLKLNYDELKLVSDYLLEREFNTEKSARELQDKYNIDLLCVTMGEEGSVLFQNGELHSYSEKVDDIVDTVGAGDGFAAVLCIGYLKNWDLADINKRAAKFAAEICKLEGALPKDNEFYNKFLEEFYE
jgi:fructokinase